MNTGQNFIQNEIEKETDYIKFEINIKNFKEINDFLRFIKKKIANLHVFNIKINFEIYYKDKRCRF